jgi:L-amino acid N-acyltransferase YncA
MLIRDARSDDMPAVLGLYNARVLTTTVGWAETLQTLDERDAWFAERQRRGDVVLVAEDIGDGASGGSGRGGGGDRGGDGVGGAVVGFAAYGPFRNDELWPGYRFTVEHTVHLDEAHLRKGLGRLLMEALIARATEAGKHVMVGAIDGANEGSIAFHAALGFVEVARMPETGWKFGRWLDLVLMQRVLDPGAAR